MIKKSEEEIVKLNNDDESDSKLRESLFLKRKSIEQGQKFESMKLL